MNPFRVELTDLKMRYVAAALLTALAGNEINAENIEKILSSVGIEAEKDLLSQVIFNL